MLTIDDVRAAARRLDGIAYRTPTVTSATVDLRTGAEVVFKAENLQRAGSFKVRGAYNRVATLREERRFGGVVAHSSGNHGQAVALVARMFGVEAVVVMPSDAPEEKRAATAGYGAEVVVYDRAREDRERRAAAIATERGFPVVPPYDDPLVMAGQGTAALELVEDAGRLDLLLVPVGGGGLIAGCATAAKGVSDGVRVVGVEPAGADDTRRSLAAGRRIRIDQPESVADGLLAPIPGEATFPVNRRLVDEVVTVSDAEILETVVFLLERMKLLVEPSGACAAAALLSGRVSAPGRRVGVVLSGGNLAAARLVDLVGRRGAGRGPF